MNNNNKIISLFVMILFIFSTLSITTASANIPDLILHYDFGYDAAYDRSDNNNHGTPIGPSSVGDPAPTSEDAYGESFDFDGVNDYVDANNPSYIKNLNEGTVSAWVKTTDNSAVIFSSGSTTTNYVYFMFLVNNNQMAFYVYGSGYTCLTRAGSNVANGQWQNLIWTSDGNAWKMYQNGNLVANVPTSTCNAVGTWFNDYSSNNFAVGVLHRPSMYGYADGRIDELKIYDQAVTEDQAVNIFNGEPLEAEQPWDQHGFNEYQQSTPGMKINEISSSRIASSYDGSGSSGYVSTSIYKPIDITQTPIFEIDYSFNYGSNYYMGGERIMFYDNDVLALWTGHHDAWAGSTSRYYIRGYQDGTALSNNGYETVYSQNSITDGKMRVEFSNIDSSSGTADAYVKIDKAGGGTYIKLLTGVSIPNKVRLYFHYHDSYWSSNQAQTIENYQELDYSISESNFDWLAVPTNGGNSYSTSWTVGSHGRTDSILYGPDYFDGFSIQDKLIVDETFTNVLRLHRDGGFVYYIKQSGIQLNTMTDFSISLDYKSLMVGSTLENNPGFKVSWASGGTAWIKDTQGSGAQWGVNSFVSSVTPDTMNSNYVYRLQIKGDVDNIYIMMYDRSSNLDRPSTNKDDPNWNILETYPRDGSFQGDISIQLGSLTSEYFSEDFSDEDIIFANLGFTTGLVPTPEATFHLHDIMADKMSSSQDYNVDVCEMGAGSFRQGPACGYFTIYDGAIALKLTDIHSGGNLDTFVAFGNEEQYDYNIYWRLDYFRVKRYEVYRPLFYLTSNEWHDMEFKYSQTDYEAVTITQTFDRSLSVNVGGTTAGVGMRSTTSLETSFSQSVSLPSVRAEDGAMVAVYAKFLMYEIEATYSSYDKFDELLDTKEFHGFVMTRTNIADRMLVHSALNIPEIRGDVSGVEELASSPFNMATVSDPYSIGYDLKSSQKRTVSQSITYSFGAKITGKISGIGVGVSASVKFSFGQSFTSSQSNSLKYNVYFTPSELGPSTFYEITVERYNNFGLIVRKS